MYNAHAQSEWSSSTHVQNYTLYMARWLLNTLYSICSAPLVYTLPRYRLHGCSFAPLLRVMDLRKIILPNTNQNQPTLSSVHHPCSILILNLVSTISTIAYAFSIHICSRIQTNTYHHPFQVHIHVGYVMWCLQVESPTTMCMYHAVLKQAARD